MNKIPVIIDCDPGIDDVLALMLAITKENLDIMGITTVCGNVSCDLTTHNAGLILNALGETIPLAQGASKPLVRDHVSATVHGSDGLGDKGNQLPQDVYPYLQAIDASQFIIQVLSQATEPITIIAIGPLTNIALVLKQAPHLKSKIKQLSIMGGGLKLGNKTPYAEFNIYVDPEACDVVLNSGIDIVLAPLNATLQAYLHPDDIKHFDFISKPITTFIYEIMRGYAQKDAALHDLCAVLWVSNPGLFSTEAMYIAVDTTDEFRGRTYRIDDKEPNVQCIVNLKRACIIKALVDAFYRLQHSID